MEQDIVVEQPAEKSGSSLITRIAYIVFFLLLGVVFSYLTASLAPRDSSSKMAASDSSARVNLVNARLVSTTFAVASLQVRGGSACRRPAWRWLPREEEGVLFSYRVFVGIPENPTWPCGENGPQPPYPAIGRGYVES